MNRIAVIIPARNEELVIEETLDKLLKNKFVEQVVVVDDGSSDATGRIAMGFIKTEVIYRADRGYNAVGKPELAETFNVGFNYLEEKVEYDYVLILGADTHLPPNYIEELLEEFKKNPKLVMASGVIRGERTSGYHVRGTGRMIKRDFWQLIDAEYPVVSGWESYPIYFANYQEYNTKAFSHIEMDVIRVTGDRTNYYDYGIAMRALGYFWLMAIGRSGLLFFKRPKGAIKMLCGYFRGVERVEEDLRRFVRRSQRKRLLRF